MKGERVRRGENKKYKQEMAKIARREEEEIAPLW